MHANIRPFTTKGDGKTAVKLVEDPDVKKAILADLQAIGKAKLPRNALICDVHLIPGCEVESLMWTPDNGCLTASNKLQRNIVQKMFKKEIDFIKQSGIL